MKDTDLMPFGKFKGMKMGNVPASYLLWLYEKNMNVKTFGKMDDVTVYINDNLDLL